MLLDKAGNIFSVSHAFERILGFRREEIEGRDWTSLVAPLGEMPAGSRWLSQVQAGAFRRHRVKSRTKDGREIFLSLEVSRLGQHRQCMLLLTVRVEERGSVSEQAVAGPDFDYYIRVSAIEFGTLQKVVELGRPVRNMVLAEPKCFQFFDNRDSPCPDCPVLRPMHEPWPRVTVRKLNGSTKVITAHPVDAITLQLSVRKIDDHVLKAVHGARTDALAKKAGLSDRERIVFKYLLMGRSQQDIAKILKLSRRTVKFHVSNVLDKIGADSRIDLIRLIGF